MLSHQSNQANYLMISKIDPNSPNNVKFTWKLKLDHNYLHSWIETNQVGREPSDVIFVGHVNNDEKKMVLSIF
jgi:hypothetical protein